MMGIPMEMLNDIEHGRAEYGFTRCAGGSEQQTRSCLSGASG
jgi:hypothetical protein